VHSLPAGDSVSAQRAPYSAAVRVFERRQPGNDPDRFIYFADADLAAEFSHRVRDAAQFATGVTYAQRGTTGSARSDFFVTIVLAAGHLGSWRRGPGLRGRPASARPARRSQAGQQAPNPTVQPLPAV
jgi:hypothetical protein